MQFSGTQTIDFFIEINKLKKTFHRTPGVHSGFRSNHFYCTKHEKKKH